jgi:hypothetical protein
MATAAMPSMLTFVGGDGGKSGISHGEVGWRLVKVGARVVYHARRWHIHVASAFSLARYYRILFA